MEELNEITPINHLYKYINIIVLQNTTGLPGSQYRQPVKITRNTLNVDDIEGAVPKRLVGVCYYNFQNNLIIYLFILVYRSTS